MSAIAASRTPTATNVAASVAVMLKRSEAMKRVSRRREPDGRGRDSARPADDGEDRGRGADAACNDANRGDAVRAMTREHPQPESHVAQKRHRHSDRSASIGSIRTARIAGSALATSATAASNATTARNVSGSRSPTLKSSVVR